MDTIVITAIVSALAAVLAAVLTALLTAFLTRRREREADWRKLKLAQYQEYVAALSGIVEGRASPDAHQRYTDAANALMLVAPAGILQALDAYLAETSVRNPNRSRDQHDRLLNVLLRTMRKDIHAGAKLPRDHRLSLLSPPPSASVVNTAEPPNAFSP